MIQLKPEIFKFLVGPFIEKELYIDWRKIKNTISDAFIKTI